jgi:hypothetical protein
MSAIETREQRSSTGPSGDPRAAPSGSAGVWVPAREPVGEKSRVEIEEADTAVNWMYSGPGVVPPDPRRKVWRQNVATGAIEEKALDASVRPEWGTYHKVARKELEGGGERLQSKDFPHAPTKEQELREEEDEATAKAPARAKEPATTP